MQLLLIHTLHISHGGCWGCIMQGEEQDCCTPRSSFLSLKTQSPQRAPQGPIILGTGRSWRADVGLGHSWWGTPLDEAPHGTELLSLRSPFLPQDSKRDPEKHH